MVMSEIQGKVNKPHMHILYVYTHTCIRTHTHTHTHTQIQIVSTRLNVTLDLVECQVQHVISNTIFMLTLITNTDLTLSFVNARLLDDVSFHPCIRYKRWEVCTDVHVIVKMYRVYVVGRASYFICTT